MKIHPKGLAHVALIVAVSVVVIVLAGVIWYFMSQNNEADTANTNTANISNTANSNNLTNTVVSSDPEGTILVEAGDGVLSGAQESSMDYIKESARGFEAYLGSKGATATYNVEVETSGTYKLYVKLSDDGTWNNGYRDATITVNGAVVLNYLHTSEDTRGWKWYTLGNVSLKEGKNTVAFTKTNDMPAAYVMDEFKFTPVILN